MTALTDVTLTTGVPTAGSGTVSTLDKFNGTAGSSTTQALTVQGIASGTAMPVSVATIPSHAVTNAGTFAVQVTSAPSTAVTNAGTFATQSKITDGTNTATVKAASTAPVTATDSAVVTVIRPDSAGIIATGTQAAPSAAYLSTVAAGDVATAATDSGNPVKIGGIAKTANPSAVTDGQRANALFDKLGKQVVVGSVRDLKGNQFTTITASVSETTVVTAVASTFLDVYGCIVENTSATACKVTFKDSTAGTTQFEIYVPAGDTRGFMMPESGAFKQTTVNTAWTATCGTSVSSIVITMLYVKNI